MEHKKVERRICPAGVHTVSDRKLAETLSVSIAQVRRMEADGQLPRALRYQKTLWWSGSELDAWDKAGRPARAAWERQRGIRDMPAPDEP